MIKLIDENINIKYIYHLSDFHISDGDRKEEYNEVFENFIKSLKKNKAKKTNSIVIVTGDIFDSPESGGVGCSLFLKFIQNVTKITNLILIEGNHDINKKTSSVSLIQSLVGVVDNKSAFVLTKSCNYEYGNLIFSYTHFLDKKVNNVQKNINKKVITLYHGNVKDKDDKAKFYIKELEKNSDLVLLGEYHEYNKFSNKTFACGSLLQHKSGESFNKGFIKFNLSDKIIKHKFIKVSNDYGFIKIYCEEINSIDYQNIPEKLRVHFINNEKSQISGEMLKKKLLEKGKKIIEFRETTKYLLEDFIDKDIFLNDYSYKFEKRETRNIIIEEVVGYNFMKFSYIKLNLTNGKKCVYGGNSCGKTVMYRLIYFGLFGLFVEDLDNSYAVKAGRKQCDTTIILKVNNEKIKIARKLDVIRDVLGNGEKEEYISIFKNGENILISKTDSLNWIRNNIINEEQFLFRTYIDGYSLFLNEENKKIKRVLFEESGAYVCEDVKKDLQKKLNKEKEEKKILSLRKSLKILDSRDSEKKIKKLYLDKIEKGVNLYLKNIEMEEMKIDYISKRLNLSSEDLNIRSKGNRDLQLYELAFRLGLQDESLISINLLFIDGYNLWDNRIRYLLKLLKDVFKKKCTIITTVDKKEKEINFEIKDFDNFELT